MNASANRELLVVAYYFPPMGLSGVQRVAKFVKYLPEFGWNPTVLTVKPGGYFAFDAELEKEVTDAGVSVVRTDSFDVNRIFGRSRRVSLPAERARGILTALSQTIFVPDNKVGWMWPALRAAKKLIRRRTFSAVLSSAPPYTAHLIGRRIARMAEAPLIADFRDDWVGNPRHVYPTPFHRRAHVWLERTVCRDASCILTINDTIAQSLHERHGVSDAIRVITQGFDPADFAAASSNEEDPDRFVLLYTGVFYDAQRPDTLFRAAALLRKHRPDLFSILRLEFAGLLPQASVDLAKELGIDTAITFRGYLSHRSTVSKIMAADALWMTVGRRPGSAGISTGKLFEYFGSGKPILALVPDGEARSSLEPYGATYIAEPDDEQTVAQHLEAMILGWKQKMLPVANAEYVQQFDRRRLTARLAEICYNVTNEYESRRTR